MSKNRTEVIIGGNIYFLQSEDTEEHMQAVAKLINVKIDEINKAYDKCYLNQTKLTSLLTLNLADECVKTQQQLAQYKNELEKKMVGREELEHINVELRLEVEKLKQELALSTHKIKKRTNE